MTSIENAFGSALNDVFISGPESNTFDGDGDSGAGGQTIYGFVAGGDTVSYQYSTTPVIVDLSVDASWDGYVNDWLHNVENVSGSAYDDTIYSSSAPNFLNGGNGSDLYVFVPNFNSDTIASMTDGGDHIRLAQFGSIDYQSLLITPDPTGVGSDIRVIGDANVIHVLDMNPDALTADYFLFA